MVKLEQRATPTEDRSASFILIYIKIYLILKQFSIGIASVMIIDRLLDYF